MALMTGDELARGIVIIAAGSAAGGAVIAFPGSGIWLLPAAAGAIGCMLTVPDVRQEVTKALPGASAAVRGLLPSPRTPPGSRAAANPQTAQAGQQERHPLWEIEDDPHRLVVGHTRGGKTTLMHTMALRWAAGKQMVVVIDPDASPGQWPGCKVAGHGDNYEAITEAVGVVGREVKRRRDLRAEGQRTFPPVHVIIDEAADVFAEVPAAKDLSEAIARRGAKLNMHLTLGCQDRQVKTLGLEGKSKLLENLREIHVMRQGDQRVAVLGDQTIPIPPLPDPESFIRTRQRPTAAPAQNHTDTALLDSLLCSVPPHSPGTEQNSDAVLTAVESGKNITVNVNARAEVSTRPQQKKRVPNIHAMAQRAQRARLLAAYKEAGATGETFRGAYARLGGDRTATLKAWQSGKAKEGTK